MTITIYLIGLAGVGKYTIAQELAKSGYKIVDNHLINNPIFSLLDSDRSIPIPEKAWAAIQRIRTSVLDFVAEDTEHNYVFTNVLHDQNPDRQIYEQVKETAEKRRSVFVPVTLRVAPEEHEKRITTPSRALRFKPTYFDKTVLDKPLILIEDPHLLDMDITSLSSVQAAEKILRFVEQQEK